MKENIVTRYSGWTCGGRIGEINAVLLRDKGKVPTQFNETDRIDYFCFPRIGRELPEAPEVDEYV